MPHPYRPGRGFNDFLQKQRKDEKRSELLMRQTSLLLIVGLFVGAAPGRLDVPKLHKVVKSCTSGITQFYTFMHIWDTSGLLDGHLWDTPRSELKHR